MPLNVKVKGFGWLVFGALMLFILALVITLPSWVWLILGVLGLIYIINPYDIIPDFIPVVGWLDDGLITVFTIFSFLTFMIPSLVKTILGVIVLFCVVAWMMLFLLPKLGLDLGGA